jgi:phosphatidylglycerophosphate synthase
MQRPSLTELDRICQKPQHRRVGNWMARRVSRPMALRVTWLVAPWGASAHLTTLAAWTSGVAAAAALASGTVGGWLTGAVLLQLWYLSDHVDGQLARLRGTASLDGAELDYLMHHTVNLLVPLGAGFGLFVRNAEPLWLAAGLAWGLGMMLVTLHHDARYKTFIQRLKRLRGCLVVHGGAGDRPQSQPPIPRQPVHLAAWTARKLCETHVVMNLLALAAVTQWLLADAGLLAGRLYLTAMALVAPAVAVWTIARSVCRQSAEREFAAWYRVPPGHCLTFADGWWTVEVIKDKETTEITQSREAAQHESS